MKTLVPRDQLVGEGEARHQPPLLQPEEGAEGATSASGRTHSTSRSYVDTCRHENSVQVYTHKQMELYTYTYIHICI